MWGLGSCPRECAAAYAPRFQRLACCWLAQKGSTQARHQLLSPVYYMSEDLKDRSADNIPRSFKTSPSTKRTLANTWHTGKLVQEVVLKNVACAVQRPGVFGDSFVDTPLLGSFFSRKNLISQQCVRIAHPIYDTVVATTTWRHCVESA